MTLHSIIDTNCRGLGGGVFARQLTNTRRRDARNLRRTFGGPGLHAFGQRSKAHGVLGHVIGIMQAFGDDHMHHGQGQRGVCTGANRNPFVGGLGGARVGRVDHDDACTLFARLLNKRPEVQVAGQRIAAPDQDQAAMGIGFRRHTFGRANAIKITLKTGLGANGACQVAGAHPIEEARGHTLAL